MRILFIEDVKDDVELVRETLAHSGISAHITQADSAPSLHEALQQSPFDIAIVDFVLPRIGGLEAVGIVRASLPGTPIVLLTGALDAAALANVVSSIDAALLKGELHKLPQMMRELLKLPTSVDG